ncbi:MAG: aminotransferase class I/II-fold pyridoxal phosphate-dependent enzyme [Christensenellaceae bacterium]|jgi:histidinol-phosphate aminotransferase|nr:aminotransferase class I/II-fold pyridoxal phosphate-dependent enzyme [Christensenellaceae bacterium]
MFLSEKIRAIEPYVPGEQPPPGSMIKLNTNENPYPPSRAVEGAILGEIENLRLYPEINAERFLLAVAKIEGLKPENVFAGNGSDEVLSLCFPAFFGEGRPVRFPALSYSFYPSFAQLFSVPYGTAPMKGDDGLEIDPEALLAGGGVVLANPNAPSGRALPLTAVRRLAAALLARGEVLVVDEAYTAFGGESARPLIEEFPNLLVVRTLSKDHSLAGLRVGYALGEKGLIDGLRRVKDSFNSYPLDRLAIAAATAAIEDGAYTKACIEKIVATRDWFYGEALKRGFTGQNSKTNFLFLRHGEREGAWLYDELKKRRILVRRFARPGIEEYLRISVGTREEMAAMLRALDEILGGGGKP